MTSTTFIPSTPDQADVTVSNNGWYPIISLNELRSQMRITNDVDNTQLGARTQDAIIAINETLDDWRTEQLALGYNTFESIPCDVFGDERRTDILYKTAVHHRTKRLLLEQDRYLSTQARGREFSDVTDGTSDDLLNQETWAIRQLRGESGSWAIRLI